MNYVRIRSRTMTTRTNIYTAILNLIQYLRREFSATRTPTGAPALSDDLEAVLCKHRAAILQVCVVVCTVQAQGGYTAGVCGCMY